MIAAIALVHLGFMLYAMATSSLVTDEFGSILSFAGKGPIKVITDYSAPKNHIFYNLVNSIFPGRNLLDPLRARFLSFSAAVALAGTLLTFGIIRRRFFECTTLLTFWAFSTQLLELDLQARGYGLLSLAAVLSCCLLIVFFENPRLRWAIALGIITTLGTYTVPGYLFFGAPIMLFLWTMDRRWSTFLITAATALAILLLYAPVLSQLIIATAKFHEQSEMDFAFVHGIFRTLKLYLFPSTDWQIFLIFLVLTLAPFALLPPASSIAKALQTITLSSLTCFTILLVLRTPPVRMAAFATLPFAFAGILAIGDFLRRCRTSLPSSAIMLTLTLAFAAHGVVAIRHFTFVPWENWKEAARALELAFPTTTSVDASRHGKYIKYYLTNKARAISFEPLDLQIQKNIVFVEADNKWERQHLSKAPSSKNIHADAEIVIPGSIRDIRLRFPSNPVSISHDLSSTQTEHLHLVIPIPRNAYALVLLFDQTITEAHAGITALLFDEQKRTFFTAGNAIIIPLQQDPALSELTIDLQVRPTKARLLSACFTIS